MTEASDSKIQKESTNTCDYSLKTSVIFESFIDLKQHFSRISGTANLEQCLRLYPNALNSLIYYRYPESTLPVVQKKNIKKALSMHQANPTKYNSSEAESLSWYRHFSDNWRKALLSAFENLKLGVISEFFYLQENLTVYFQRDDMSVSPKAYMRLMSYSLLQDFEQHGNWS